ncbi:MAG: orotidine-5'-phosphate decarboxylase [Clostridiales bacterium]|nr:orotidine-5'-phosphate decarboxylase [Clostridiales bacterium]
MSVDILIERIIRLQNPSVMGLDPAPQLIPPHLLEQAQGQNPFERAANAVTLFNRGLIDAVCDILPAVKPQLACYEQLRHEGMRAYYDTVRHATQRGLFVIADAKRGDIGSTCDYYAAAHLGEVELYGERLPVFDADALTVNPYLGSDGLAPFMKTGKLLFVLTKTSNPSSGEFQDRLLEGTPLYRAVAERLAALGREGVGRFGYDNLGAVVGATYPEQLAELRRALPHTFFLVPGYGAQGGGGAEAAAAFDGRGLGAIVNSSRGIIGAWKKTGDGRHFAEAAREAALAMREELRACIGHPIGEGVRA